MSEVPDEKDGRVLLSIARDAIVSHIKGSSPADFPIDSAALQGNQGCFVTIRQNEKLRGCIGSFVSDEPLCLLVREMAISAATRDPRFTPMTEKELDDFTLEISVLSPLSKVDALEKIRVGEHGLYIVKGRNRGVLLPQVAVEYGWSRDEFLGHTCLKAGLAEDAWRNECDIFVFTARIFSE